LSSHEPPGTDKETILLALLKDVPVINHPLFRIVLGVALIAVGLVFHQVLLAALGGFLLVIGVVRGVSVLTGHGRKGQPR
jgi:hypothetical protein